MEVKCKWNLSANETPILNAQKWEGVIGSLQKKYSRGPWNLPIVFNTKMSKVKTIAKLMDTYTKSSLWWKPTN
jgi:hypothetical protein